ncbi:MAG: AEC family transporter [Oleiphilaceae bacterium]|nr:AEC family transporter [Oleiphilaceae bacterium]
MQQILLVTSPFFLLVLGGFLAGRFRVLPHDSIPGLNTFVLYFALPAMLYRFGAETPTERLLDAGIFATYLLCALVMVAIVLFISRRGGLNWNDSSFGALVAAFPNSGFMGMPLLIALVGAEVAGPLIITIAVDMIITSSLCIALSQLAVTGDSHIGQVVVAALKRVLVNPLPWAILLGGLASATGFELFGPLMQTVDMMADAGPPAALFTIGAVLARSQAMASQPPASGGAGAGWANVPQIVFLKLVLHPLLVLAAGKSLIWLGVSIDPYALTMLVLVAALPSASNVPMLTERYRADTGRVARIVLITTALSFLTFSTVVALVL